MAIMILNIGFIVYYLFKRYDYKIIFVLAISSVGFNVMMNGYFYPQLLKFQSTSQSIEFIQDQNIAIKDITFIDLPKFGLRYFCRGAYNSLQTNQLDQLSTPYVICSEKVYNSITASDQAYEEIKKFKNFRVSKLTGKFLNPNTREAAINFAYLLKIKH